MEGPFFFFPTDPSDALSETCLLMFFGLGALTGDYMLTRFRLS
jgi:hypothetical protein